MPQMAPMMWLILFFLFIFTFLMFNILNYFNFLKFQKSTIMLKSLDSPNQNYSTKNSLNWKW